LPWIFAVATDMPFVRPQLIEFLAAQRISGSNDQAVVPMHDGHPQPLAAFYSVACRPAIGALLEGAGRRSLRAALEQINVRYVDEMALRGADASLRSFFDLDTPQDVATAAHHLLQDNAKKG
jgi:molybdopterin-guanine dinucleotide biosynthesis protein A